jgi:hypothetical protein
MKRQFLVLGVLAVATLAFVQSRLIAKPVELGSKWEITCTNTETGEVTYHATNVEYPVSNFLPRNSRTVCVGRRLPK